MVSSKTSITCAILLICFISSIYSVPPYNYGGDNGDNYGIHVVDNVNRAANSLLTKNNSSAFNVGQEVEQQNS
ncbi:unnamed protein product, partial [Brenthis ino]